MVTIKKIAIGLMALLFAAGASAAGKVAVVNIQQAIIQTEAAQKKIQALNANADFAAMKAKFESLQADLVALDKDAKTNGMTWTDEQKTDHVKKVEYKKADLKLVAEKLKAEQNTIVKQIMQEQLAAAREALSQLVNEESIGLVLDASTGVAVYATQEYDITAKLTEKMNKK